MLDDVSDPKEFVGSRVTGNRGIDLGEVDAVYLDEKTQRPEWVAVMTGMFGADVSVVPLAEAVYRDGVLRLPYTREQVRNAPHQPADRRLTPQDELVPRRSLRDRPPRLRAPHAGPAPGVTVRRRGLVDGRECSRHRAGTQRVRVVGQAAPRTVR